MLNLAAVLEIRFERTNAAADAEEMRLAFTRAATIGSAAPSVRITAALVAGEAISPDDPGRAADLLETAVRLLPEVTPRELQRDDQQHALGPYSGLASVAAAFALADMSTGSQQRAVRALRLLEAGRAVLLSQALDARSDLTDLEESDPALAQQFVELRDALDQPGEASPPRGGWDAADSLARMGQAYQARRDLADQLSATLARIRALEGFASFALPPATDELLAEAYQGPIVTFNVSPYRSDALLLTQDGITAIELPELTPAALIDRINTFRAALQGTSDAGDDPREARRTMTQILEWLWDVAADPVLTALGYITEPSSDATWPRVWWAPGGLLSLLPLHAAGYHTEPASSGRSRWTVLDRVISSYTPTIRALRYARQHAADPSARATPESRNGHSLIVAMPTTPGLPEGQLTFVRREAELLAARLPLPVLLSEPDPGGPVAPAAAIPTKANVLAYLPACKIAHFACHGESHPTDPSKSRLLLDDHQADPFTVSSLAAVNVDQAQLAYLSACNTAITRPIQLIDEAIHLTSAFQLAGFPHVIGTLWEIEDEHALSISNAFYAALLTGVPDISRTASALHGAVRTLRDKFPGTPSIWAAHVHAGA